MARLWPGSPSGVSSFSDGNTWEQGVQFEPTRPGRITGFRWYRHNTTAGHAPTGGHIWDKSSSVAIVTPAGVPDDGLVGWQTYDLPTPYVYDTSQDIIASWTYPAGIPFATTAQSNAPAPDSGMAWLSPKRAYRIGAGIPNGFNDFANVTPIDIIFEATDVEDPDTTPTNFTVDESLARWFASGDQNVRTDELPWQTKVAIDLVQEAVDAVAADVTTEITRTAGLTGGTLQSALDAVVTALKGAGSATLTALDTAIAAVQAALDATEAVMNATADLMRWLAGGPSGLAPASDPGWTTVDSGAFSGPFSVSGQFDRLYVHITTVGGANTSTTFESWEFGSFAWWWCPIFGNMAGRYHTSRAREAALYEPGMRMEGALVVLPADFQGTYEAVRFDG